MQTKQREKRYPSAATEAFKEIAKDQLKTKKEGTGQPTPVYLLEDYQEWQESTFGASSHEVIHSQNKVLREVLDCAFSLSEKYLTRFSQNEGPSKDDRTAHARGYRCVRIIVDEFKIKHDPVTLVATQLHEIYGNLAIHPDKLETFLEEMCQRFTQLLGKTRGHQFCQEVTYALQRFYKLDAYYARINQQVLKEFEAEVLKEIEKGITAASYEELKQKIIHSYVGPKEGKYFDLATIIQYAHDGTQAKPEKGSSEVAENTHPGTGLTEMLIQFARTIDTHRYHQAKGSWLKRTKDAFHKFWSGIRHTSPEVEPDSLSAHMIAEALGDVFNFRPLARTLDLQPAVDRLSHVAAYTFFEKQWQALQEALRDIANERKNGRSLQVQLRANVRAVENFISDQTKERQVETYKVSAEEFEARKILLLAGKWDGPLLGSHEYCILSSIKSPGSIFSKWLGDARRNKLHDQRWIEENLHHLLKGTGTTLQEKQLDALQASLARTFSRKETWKKYLEGANDPLRCTVVLGSYLAEVFAVPDAGDATTVYEQIQELLQEDGASLNKFRGSRREIEETVEWRVAPTYRETEQGKELFYEFHLVLLLKKFADRMKTLNIPFEAQVVTEEQWRRNNFGEESHFLYKMYELERYASPEERQANREKMVRQYREIVLYLYQSIYNGSLEGLQ